MLAPGITSSLPQFPGESESMVKVSPTWRPVSTSAVIPNGLIQPKSDPLRYAIDPSLVVMLEESLWSLPNTTGVLFEVRTRTEFTPAESQLAHVQPALAQHALKVFVAVVQIPHCTEVTLASSSPLLFATS